MSLPNAMLRTVELSFYGKRDQSEFEKQRQLALNAINYAGNLGLLIAYLSVNKTKEIRDPDAIPDADTLNAFDDALFVVGELQTALMDTAYAAVEEAFDVLKESKN